MNKSEPITDVIFRRDRTREGEVIALFPGVAGTCHEPYTCSAYVHTGQHTSADLAGVIHRTRLATQHEAVPLARELRGLGYRLRVIKRAQRHHLNARRIQLAHH